jgi:hypothetical protein
MPKPLYRALRILLRMFSLSAVVGGLLMIFAGNFLIARIFSAPPEQEVSHPAPFASQGNGRHGTHARRSLVARFTRSSRECGHRGRTHCRALHSGIAALFYWLRPREGALEPAGNF